MTTFVLVHGVAHGAWCWQQTVADLEAAGHAVVALDLPLTSLTDDAAVVSGALDSVDAANGPTVLVGHSYGGLVISKAAADRTDVAHLVYVAAIMLQADELFTVVGSDFSQTQLGDALVVADDGTFTVREEAAPTAFYNACSEEAAKKAASQLRKTAFACVMSPPGAEPWRTIPSTYVLCDRDQAIHPDMQRAMAQHATTTVVIDTDHSPFISTPKEMLNALVTTI